MTTTRDRTCRLSSSNRRGWTIIEVLAVLLIVTVPPVTTLAVAARYGNGPGFTAGILSSFACLGVILAIYGTGDFRNRKTLRALSTSYPFIYRVKEVPSEPSRVWLAAGATIEIGDYGWEAEPIHADGLIYLQGLSERWGVVWYAGFRADQIEEVARKPRTQYLLPSSWYLAGPDAFPCPFPIQARETADLGMPLPLNLLRLCPPEQRPPGL